MTSPHFATALAKVADRRDLSPDAAHAAFAAIMEGGVSEIEIAAFLIGLRVKGETPDELVGAARAMQERCTPVVCRTPGLLDTCGTGGDGLHTFNISTAAAIVVAATGVPIAKHGNRSVSSTSGSSEVLAKLGLNLDQSPERVAESIDTIGLGFCFAPLHHAAMKHVAPVRRQLGLRTIFNLLGPLVNPASAAFQLLGTSSNANARLLAEALRSLGRERAVVVCGNDELDEVSLWGETRAFEVADGAIVEHRWNVTDFGLPESHPDQLRVDSCEASAAIVTDLLAGAAGPPRNIVLANAAAALWTVQSVPTLVAGVELAARTIDGGVARTTLERMVSFSRET